MSERALGFVEEWVSEHIHGGASAGATAQAKTLAAQCVADAAAAGIPEYEIAEAIEDLPAFMAGAIEEANERGADEEEDE